MLIANIGIPTPIQRLYSHLPYVWSVSIVYDTTSTYWHTVYGAPIESQLSAISVSGVNINSVVYSGALTLVDCLGQPGSWYFDVATQRIHVHLNHDVEGLIARAKYGRVIGFSDDQVVSINGIEYEPLIKGAPSLSQVQDLQKYDRLALVNGDMVLDNVGGQVDFLLEEALIGSDVTLSYLPQSAIDDIGDAPGDAVVPLNAFYVEDFKPGLSEFRISLQDKRKSQDATFPQSRFSVVDYPNLGDDSVDIPIPVVYGYQRELRAYPVNGKVVSTTVRYRAGLLLTALTTVWVRINDTWTLKTPTNINLPTGEFDVAGARASSSDTPYDCRVEATGIAVVYASDVIKDLNDRFAGVHFTDSNYDTDEWEAEQVSLKTIGIVFDDDTTIFDAVAKVQGGCNVGFRYEVNAFGQRTIRIDRDDRQPLGGIDNVDILDSTTLRAEVDSQFLSASIRIGYRHSDESGKYLTVADSTYAADVLENYRIMKETRFDTWLTNLTDATARAVAEAAKNAVPITTLPFTARGERYMTLRLLDIMPVAINSGMTDLDTGETDGRPFFGVRYCKIIGIQPDYKLAQNKLRVEVLEPITPNRPDVIVAGDGITEIISGAGEVIISGGS
jgi:hypothetical protein